LALPTDNAQALPPAVDADRQEFSERAGRLSYYVAGDGPPFLLLHSINAAGSVYEVRPVFEELRRTHRVYAPDLPGFGFSDRSARDYTVSLYVDAVLDMLNRIADDYKGTPVDALALSLSSEFLARAAAQHPSRFRSLTLVTPTGFRAGSDRLREAEGVTREMPWLSAVLEFPLWRKGLYRQLVRPGTIRYFLRRTFGSDNIDEGLAAYDDITTHQPGAENAPYAFLSGRLFSKDIRNVYERLGMPVWLAHGTRGDFGDFRGADWTHTRENWTVQAYDTGALPFYETPGPFFASLRTFLDSPPGIAR
jgi:pimeloyl-ACP methyl ester carboxylesterase